MPIQKILLVDDSKTELHVLSELLTKSGYAVRTAENGEEAMRRLRLRCVQRVLRPLQPLCILPTLEHVHGVVAGRLRPPAVVDRPRPLILGLKHIPAPHAR